MRILHAIHDFLPRHQAGSEIYAFELCRALAARHHVTVVCADFDPTQRHGTVRWRACDGLPVADIVNNWACASFEDTYRSPLMTRRLAQLLRAVQPDLVHVHSLHNLSFELPALARARGIPVVATLHDYTLVCPSGGQRIHRAEAHVCHDIDPVRCARCFAESPIADQMSFAKLARVTGAPGLLRRAALTAARRLPAVAARARRAARGAAASATPPRIETRLDAARRAMEHVDLLIAPSPSIAAEFARLGIAASKIRVSDYGFVPLRRVVRIRPPGPLRIGYVGTLVWHKGVHVLIEAVRRLPPGACELKVFGDPNVFPGYAAELRDRAAGLPVRFMGTFGRDAVAGTYAQFDVLAVPSLWLENSPLVIHEAFMAGVPVVATRAGGVSDLVDDGRNGLLCPPGDAAALAAALQSLADRPSRLAALVAAAPRVKTIDEDAREWDAIYAELARAAVPSVETL
jgi:glycosyltransferase involved in cell wall biosynthesis